jgi:hypothetical protein
MGAESTVRELIDFLLSLPSRPPPGSRLAVLSEALGLAREGPDECRLTDAGTHMLTSYEQASPIHDRPTIPPPPPLEVDLSDPEDGPSISVDYEDEEESGVCSSDGRDVDAAWGDVA